MATAVSHYTSYKARPFTREQRDTTTILFGGLTWKHERLVQGVFNNLNYKAKPLPNITRADLDAGKELIDVGACCPTIFTTGSLVNFLKSEVAVNGKQPTIDNYVFLTAGACGPCRFGQYHESYEMALDGMGLKDFRLFLLAQDQLDQAPEKGGGLEINMPLSLGIVWAILCGDMLTDMEYLTRPYEVVPGQTDKVRKKFDAIEVDRLQVKPKIKITGEFWLQTHEGDGNYNIKQWLEQEGSEVLPPPVAVWLGYLLHTPIWRLEKKAVVDRKVKAKILMVRGMEKLYIGTYNRFRKALGNIPYALPDQEELKTLASPFFHYELRGGEGHMLVGKALHAHLHKHANMTCELSPYSCMPNTMSQGAMANVQGRYPELLYAPIEIKGDAEVHALSLCQMILTEAKKRAQSEFVEAMAKTGMTLEKIRQIEAKRPEVKRATYRVPHLGYASTAANYVLHLAGNKTAATV